MAPAADPRPLEGHSVQAAAFLTERAYRQVARHAQHLEAATPGEVRYLDTFYIGKLSGVSPTTRLC